MLRALPKSQQARWLEIGRAFERVRRPARPGEHVAFTPVAEAGAARTIPTRFPARTARIPSGLRPAPAGEAMSPAETVEAPAAAEPSETPIAVPAVEEPAIIAPAGELVAQAEPEAVPLPPAPVEAAEATDFPPADFPLRRRSPSAGEWGGWGSYATRKDFFAGDFAAAGESTIATLAEPAPANDPDPPPLPAATGAEPPPSPASEPRAEDAEPRVSAIEYFRAAPW